VATDDVAESTRVSRCYSHSADLVGPELSSRVLAWQTALASGSLSALPMTFDFQRELFWLNELIQRLSRGDITAATELAKRANAVEQQLATIARTPGLKPIAFSDSVDSRRTELAPESVLLIGFDAAWTAANFGALVGVLRSADGRYTELGSPRVANYREAEAIVREWQATHGVSRTIILLDQPTIVTNAAGQRPVENIVCSVVSRRYGGMQPSNTGKAEMFGPAAPVWSFLNAFGGAPDPLGQLDGSCVLETYPVLAMIALEWMLPDTRKTGRLPKYNPQVRANFSLADWQHVCDNASRIFQTKGLPLAAEWLTTASANPLPRKRDQDCLDAYLCLLVALEVADGNECLVVGNSETGYIVVPYGAALAEELNARCGAGGRQVEQWVRAIRLSRAADVAGTA
jgi:predicted RNase H-like nuclease